jgi:RNA polymerase sigma factor (sigma-70 family)
MTDRYSGWSDEELIRRFLEDGNEQYMGVLYTRYRHLIYGVCLKKLRHEQESQDATTEIYERVLKGITQREIKNFKQWLYTIIHNHCMDKFRGNKLKINPTENTYFENNMALFVENEAENRLYNNPTNEDKIAQALQQLAPEQQTCIQLFYYEEKSYKEIAEITGYLPNKVKSYIQNGRIHLRRLLV